MTRLSQLTIATVLVLAASAVGAQQYRDDYASSYAAGQENVSYAYAQVTRVDPIYETVRTRVPQEQCYGVASYDVEYVHQGQTFMSRLPYDPGDRLRVRVSVQPVDEGTAYR